MDRSMFDTAPDLSRVALYARYSSHQQNPKSIDDQLRECRRRVADLGGTVIAEYADPKLTGAIPARFRPGLQSMLDDCERYTFTTVCAESMDRLSRGQHDITYIYERLDYLQIPILTIQERVVDEFLVGFKGTMNAVFLKDLSAKTRRGLIGVIESGRQVGPPAYGYRSVNQFDGTDVIRGLREIDPDTSEIVRRIYNLYIEGASARAIAKLLTDEDIPPPRRAKAWHHSRLTGIHFSTGILSNPLYKGLVVHGLTESTINPATARRTTRATPRKRWTVKPAPHLRIIDDETWEAAQERLHARSRPRTRPPGVPALARGAMPLTPLLRCAKCKGPVRTIARNRWACQSSRTNSSCTCNTRTFVLRDVDLLCARQLVSWVRYRKQWDRLIQEAQNRIVETRAHLEAEITDRTLRQRRLVTAVETGTDNPEMRQRIMELSQEIADLKAELARTADGSPLQSESRDIRPILIERARRIQSAIENGAPEIRIPATIELAGFLDHVDMSPGPGPGKARLRIQPNVISLVRAATCELAAT